MPKVTRVTSPILHTLETATTEINGMSAKVGWYGNIQYENGTPVAKVAAIQEFGSVKNKIPQRSFFRTTIVEQQPAWAKLIAEGAQAMVDGKITARQVLNLVSAKAVGDIKEKITTLTDPPLKESTVRARARKYANGEITESLKKPLVDTKIMLNSLTHTVYKK